MFLPFWQLFDGAYSLQNLSSVPDRTINNEQVDAEEGMH